MLDSSYLLPFDLFQQLVMWLGTSMEAYRKGRHFLETNQVLLRAEIEQELERLIIAHVEEKVEIKQQMQNHQELLRTVREKGGSSTAIREAYINIYGGFALDLPEWLEGIEKKRAELQRLNRPERTTRSQIRFLREAQERGRADVEMAPEIMAELAQELGYTLLQGPLPLSHGGQRLLIEEAIASYTSAIEVYTYERYPLQYARICIYLGIAYHRYGALLNEQEAIEKALTYYQSALWIYKRKEYPEKWSLVQTLMGKAYAIRRVGGIQSNLDCAIFCHEAALLGLEEKEYPEVWARAQASMGDIHQQSGSAADLAKALECYRGALRIYTQKASPRDWADLHTKLAKVFQMMASQNEQGSEILFGCAIICYEIGLKVYTPDAYAFEYATTQLLLGQTHMMRTAEKRGVNLKQAIQCYEEALTIFTNEDFPTEYQQAYYDLVEAQAGYVDSEHES